MFTFHLKRISELRRLLYGQSDVGAKDKYFL